MIFPNPCLSLNPSLQAPLKAHQGVSKPAMGTHILADGMYFFFFKNKLLFLYSAERQREGETIRGEPKAEKEVCKEEQKREIFPEELSTRLKPISKYSPFSPSLVCPKLDKYQFSN